MSEIYEKRRIQRAGHTEIGDWEEIVDPFYSDHSGAVEQLRKNPANTKTVTYWGKPGNEYVYEIRRGVLEYEYKHDGGVWVSCKASDIPDNIREFLKTAIPKTQVGVPNIWGTEIARYRKS